MNEIKNKHNKFLHPDGSVWFDLTEDVKRYEDYLIRLRLGGNDGIHKIKI